MRKLFTKHFVIDSVDTFYSTHSCYCFGPVSSDDKSKRTGVVQGWMINSTLHI